MRLHLLPLCVLAAACATTAPTQATSMESPAIVQTGDPVLRARAADVAPEQIPTPDFQALVQRMVETMRAAPGVGLAAPQIGVSLRVFVMEDPAAYQASLTAEELQERERAPVPLRTFINPVVTPVGDATAMFFEGCLSVAGFAALVERPLEVDLSGLDETGASHTLRLRGWPARIVQHEVDHLNGTLYIDRMRPRSFGTMAQVKARFSGKPIAEVRALLGESARASSPNR